MIVGTSLEAEGRVLERADQEGGCSAAACAASSSTAQGLQGMLAAVQCAACEACARLQGALQPKTHLHCLIASVLQDARLDFFVRCITGPVSPRNRYRLVRQSDPSDPAPES